NPRDLRKLGLSAGEFATVATRRGDITLVARSDSDVPPGVVFIPFCFWEAPANRLTSPLLDPYGLIPEFKLCAARIEPAG
ncbi:MAG: molybdopterin dinucleotide binding domain-containing protein, partial [Pseudomonadota bacterium]